MALLEDQMQYYKQVDTFLEKQTERLQVKKPKFKTYDIYYPKFKFNIPPQILEPQILSPAKGIIKITILFVKNSTISKKKCCEIW